MGWISDGVKALKDEVKTLKNETSLRGWVAITIMLVVGAWALYDVFTHPPKKAEAKAETTAPEREVK